MTKKEIRNVLLDVSKEEVSAQDMFMSRAYSDLIKNIIEGICRKFGKYRAEVTWEDPNVTACTDGKTVKANANCLFLDGENLINKHYLFVGGVLHEIGHLLFTDFKGLFRAANDMAGYDRLTPMADTPRTREVQKLLNEKHLGKNLAGFYKDLNNITEDGYIEPAVMKYCRGYAGCLQKRREKKFSNFSEFNPSADIQANIVNLVLQYAIMRQIKVKPEDEEDEIVVFVKSLFPLIDKASTEAEPVNRQKWTNELFAEIVLFLYAKVKEMPPMPTPPMSGGSSSEPSDESDDSDESPKGSSGMSNVDFGDNDDEEDEGEGAKGDEEDSDSTSNSEEGDEKSDSESKDGSSGSEDKEGEDSSSTSEGSPSGSDSDDISDEDIEAAIEAAMDSLSSSMDSAMQNSGFENTDHSDVPYPQKPEGSSEEGEESDSSSEDTTSKASEEDGEEEEGEGKALKSLIDAVNKERAERECDSREEREAQKIRDNIENSKEIENDYLHRPLFFRPNTTTSEDAQELYDKYHEELDVLGKRAAKLMARELQELQLGDNLTGLYSGRVTSRQLYRCETDKKAFSKKILPTDQPDMEVLIMLDASGSMMMARMISAMKAAYAMWSFCKNFGIPVSVYSHSTEYTQNGDDAPSINLLFNGENIYGKKNGSSIFNFPYSANCNIDGYAYKWTVEKLSLSSAKDKIVIFISDGLPNGDSYSVSNGIKDIGMTLPLARKRGIHTITCAIDGAAQEVEGVWCNRTFAKKDLPEFMDVSDLSTLPKTLINAIKPCIEKYL